MDISKDWWNEDDKDNRLAGVTVLFTGKHLHLCISRFRFGYRSFGFGIHRGIPGGFFGAFSYGTGQIYFNVR